MVDFDVADSPGFVVVILLLDDLPFITVVMSGSSAVVSGSVEVKASSVDVLTLAVLSGALVADFVDVCFFTITVLVSSASAFEVVVVVGFRAVLPDFIFFSLTSEAVGVDVEVVVFVLWGFGVFVGFGDVDVYAVILPREVVLCPGLLVVVEPGAGVELSSFLSASVPF